MANSTSKRRPQQTFDVTYPKRSPCYAHKLTRLIFKSCASQTIGHQAALLVIHIAHTEDAARYQGPVRFWNSQLSETLGFKSPKQLNSARNAAIEAGWLHYDREHARAVGYYRTEIPASVAKFDDLPIEDSLSEYGKQEAGSLSDNGTGRGIGSGKPSYPIPNPICSSEASSEPSSYSFATVGKGGGRWTLPQSILDEFAEAYPGIDLDAEFKKVRAWLTANKSRRKTNAGMPRFLNTWLSKAQDQSKSPPKQLTKGDDDRTAKAMAQYTGAPA